MHKNRVSPLRFMLQRLARTFQQAKQAARTDSRSKRGAPAKIGRPFPRRQIDFDFDPAQVPEAWYGGSAHLSLFWNSLSLLFPKGEQFFVNSVKNYRKIIQDPKLSAEVEGFIGQEAMHGKEHRAFNSLLKAHGLEVAEQLEAEVAELLQRVSQRAPHLVQLSVTCALEHFTAIMAEQLLEDPHHQAAIHQTVKPLWLWHALEESEHKSVAFDVFEAAGGDYWTRVSSMLVTSAVFVAVVARVYIKLLDASGKLYEPEQWRRSLWYFWGKPGLFRRLILPYLTYYRPSFHPAERDTDALLDAWEGLLFGPEGELTHALKIVHFPKINELSASAP